MLKCPRCEGKGKIIYRRWGPYPWSNEDPDAPDAGHWTETTRQCGVCHGKGQLTPIAKTLYDLNGEPPAVARGHA